MFAFSGRSRPRVLPALLICAGSLTLQRTRWHSTCRLGAKLENPGWSRVTLRGLWAAAGARALTSAFIELWSGPADREQHFGDTATAVAVGQPQASAVLLGHGARNAQAQSGTTCFRGHSPLERPLPDRPRKPAASVHHAHAGELVLAADHHTDLAA